MNNINKTADNRTQARNRLGILSKIALALAIAAFAHAAQVRAQTGYLVEVHTSAKADAGTDSMIKMQLNIRDTYGNPRTLGPWKQNGPQNDHEQNQWDVYFFPESTRAYSIDALYLWSDGVGDKPGWLWDRHYVTRIENGVRVWTWAWEKESSWIFGGWYGPYYVTSSFHP
jgi:hypothetical protein